MWSLFVWEPLCQFICSSLPANTCKYEYYSSTVYNSIISLFCKQWMIPICIAWPQFCWDASESDRESLTGFPHLLENLENIVHLEKSWNFAKNNKNHGYIMEFCQSGNVGTLGCCGNDIFSIRWNFYVNFDPKVIGGYIKNIQKNIPVIFFEKSGKIMEISWNFVSPEMWEPCFKDGTFLKWMFARLSSLTKLKEPVQAPC